MKFTNEERAVKELHCYMYCLDKHVREFEKENFIAAAVYLENAARSLKALEELRAKDETNITITLFVNGRGNDGNY